MPVKRFCIKDNVCTPYKLILNRISQYLTANGWAASGSFAESDIAIVGTCGAFASMADESVGFIREAKEQAGEIAVFGCLPSISPEMVRGFSPDYIIPSWRWEDAERLIENPSVGMDEVADATEFRLKEEYRLYDAGKQFVLIQTGCSSRCPYCPHKLGIGELKSRPAEEILRQVMALAARGVHTVVLTGNDTGSYGSDGGEMTFPELLEEVLEVSPKVHLSQLNADWVYEYRRELYPLLLNEKVEEFQVLVQTASERLLRLMERKAVVRELGVWLRRLRCDRPGIILRTDIMMGYPTATQAEEDEALEFVAGIFDEVAVHGFERFEHTPIAGMGLPFYEQQEIERRVDRAVDYLKRNGEILVHRGGQVYRTLVEIEKPKDALRRKRCTASL
jgi:tRNA A37 methylthiotransferase MiaB